MRTSSSRPWSELEGNPALPADPFDAVRVFPGAAEGRRGRRRQLQRRDPEAPVYGVPTVNIGTRQNRRFRHPSILDVPEERGAILAALANLPKADPPRSISAMAIARANF